MALDPNEQDVDEFSVGFLTRVFSEDEDLETEAFAELEEYENKGAVVAHMAGIIHGLLEHLGARYGCGHPMPVDQVWREHLTYNAQFRHDDH